MQDADPPAGDPDQAAKLRQVLSAFPGQGFAVLDGARFPDLPKLCRRERLFARSLFLDHADIEVEKAGPWLLGLGQAPDATEKVLALVGAEPAAVYWCCAAGEAVLYRHLRGLNMARVPAWAAAGGTAPPADGSGLEPSPVLFRHWDPRVLGALMPCLDAAQFSRVLGPAAEVAFLAADYSGVRRVLADADLPAASGGMIELRSQQLIALSERRVTASRLRIARYLRQVAPEETSKIADDDLLGLIAKSEDSGKKLGLTTERGLGRWAFIMAKTKWVASSQPVFRSYLTSGCASADHRIIALVDVISHQGFRA